MQRAKDLLKAFLVNQLHPINNISEFQKASSINFQDKMFELVPEAYLDGTDPIKEEIEQELDRLIRESVAFLIMNKKEVIFNEEA